MKIYNGIWALLRPSNLLCLCLYAQGAFARDLLGQSGSASCLANVDRIEAIRSAVFQMEGRGPLVPWEREDLCIPREVQELNLRHLMEGVREEMVLEETEFGQKHDRLVAMADLFRRLRTVSVNIPKLMGAWLHPFLGKALSLWEVFCQRKEASFSDESLGEIQRAAGEADVVLSSEQQVWLEELQKEGATLMVRSSGREDQENVTNAGGNLSEWTPPILSRVIEKLRAVATSFFSATSLNNRKNGGSDPCREPPVLAAVLQEFVGESASDPEIPTSFVLRTGNFSSISATFGQGKGVVEGRQADAIHCIPSQAFPDLLCCDWRIEEKKSRWVPLPERGMIQVPNPDSLQTKLSLGDKAIQTLDLYGKLLRSFFGWEEIDIEGVVLGEEIYFVQARPFLSQLSRDVSYLDLEVEAIVAEPVVMPGAFVLQFDDLESILFAATLEEAEKQFILGKHRAVFFTEPEPPLSHFAANFHNRGISCFQISDFEAVKGIELPIGLCEQTGRIFHWKDEFQRFIEEKRIVHAAPLRPSLPVGEHLFTLLPQAPLELRQLLRKVATGRADPEELQRYFYRFRERLHLLAKDLSKRPFLPSCVVERKEALDLFDREIERALQEVSASSGESKLFFLKVIEQTARFDVEEAISSIYDPLLSYQDRLPFPARFADLLLLARNVPIREAFVFWQNLLLQCEGRVEQDTLSRFVSGLGNKFDFWLLFFPPDSFASFQELVNAVPHSIQRIQALEEMEKRLESIDQELKEIQQSSSSDRVASFKQKLPVLLDILQHLVSLIPQAEQTDQEKREIDEFIAHAKTILDEAPDSDLQQLITTTGFSVINARLGTVSDRFSSNLAELFTSLHQSDLELISRLLQREISTEKLLASPFLSQEFKEAVVLLEQNDWGLSIKRVGMHVDAEGVRISYFVTLAQHSGQLELASNRLLCRFFLLGKERADPLSKWVQGLQEVGILKASHLAPSEKKFAFSCSLDELPICLPEYIEMAKATMGTPPLLGVSQLVQRWNREEMRHFFQGLKKDIFSKDSEIRAKGLEAWRKKKYEDAFRLIMEMAESAAQLDTQLLNGMFQLIPSFSEKKMAIVTTFMKGRHRGVGFRLMKTVVREGQYYKEAIQYAREGTYQKGSEAIQRAASELWRVLVEQGQAYEEAVEAAKHRFQFSSQLAPSETLPLWRALFAKGQGFAAANHLLKLHLENPDRFILVLAAALVEHNRDQNIQIIFQIAENGFRKEKTLRLPTIELWEALFQKGFGLQEALKVAQKLIENPDLAWQYSGLHLLKIPAERGVGRDLAKKSIEALRYHSLFQKPIEELEKALKSVANA